MNRKIHSPGSFLLRSLAVMGLAVLPASSAPPEWWLTRGVTNSSSPSNLSPATIGQAKWVVKQALGELQNALDASAYLALKADVEAVINLALPEDEEDRERNKSPLLVGQLKNLSKPFYNHLRTVDAAWLDKEMERAGTRIPIEGSDPVAYSPFPWPSPEDFSSATNSTVAVLGQLKAVFSFRIETLGDFDGDGLSNSDEVYYGTDPNIADSDNDGNPDGNDIDTYNAASTLSSSPAAAGPGAPPEPVYLNWVRKDFYEATDTNYDLDEDGDPVTNYSAARIESRITYVSNDSKGTPYDIDLHTTGETMRAGLKKVSFPKWTKIPEVVESQLFLAQSAYTPSAFCVYSSNTSDLGKKDYGGAGAVMVRLERKRTESFARSFLYLKVHEQYESGVITGVPVVTKVEPVILTIGKDQNYSNPVVLEVDGTGMTCRLVLVEVYDKDYASLAELKVGKMYPNVVSGKGIPGNVAIVNLDADPDRFFIRLDSDYLDSVSMKFATVGNPDSSYNDDPTEYVLEEADGVFKTKSLLLVSDEKDDNHEEFMASPIGDNNAGDRTHKIQLGGKFRITEIKVGATPWQTVNYDLPVHVKKKVRVQFVNCQSGIIAAPIWGGADIDRCKKFMQERYAQVGLEFEFLNPVVGQDIGLTGWLYDDEIIQFDATSGKLIFPDETKGAVDNGPPNDFHNTLMVYLVYRLGEGFNELAGVAAPPKYTAAADVRFKNKCFLSLLMFKDFTASHEALHVLADAIHAASPYNDFATEFANQNTLWHNVTVPAELIRKNNINVGACKRISLQQESACHASALAKPPLP